MNSPYTTMLAPQATTRPAQPQLAPAGAPMHVHRAPMIVAPPQMYQPIIQTKSGSKIASVGLILVALMLAAAAGVAGYSAATNAAPTPEEFVAYQSIAARDGVYRGRQAGFYEGRDQGIVERRTIAKWEGKIAQAKEFNKAYDLGRSQMNAAYSRRRSSGYSGYRGYAPYRQSSVSSAIASAQSIANATGAPVDVEVY